MLELILVGLCGNLALVLRNQIRDLERERRREAERREREAERREREAERREREAIDEHEQRRREAAVKHFLRMFAISAQILFTILTVIGIIQSGDYAKWTPLTPIKKVYILKILNCWCQSFLNFPFPPWYSYNLCNLYVSM